MLIQTFRLTIRFSFTVETAHGHVSQQMLMMSTVSRHTSM